MLYLEYHIGLGGLLGLGLAGLDEHPEGEEAVEGDVEQPLGGGGRGEAEAQAQDQRHHQLQHVDRADRLERQREQPLEEEIIRSVK